MSLIAKLSLAAALGVLALAGSACASDEAPDLKALLADCSSPNIERSDIDSCLERAWEMSETTPSAQLQGLTARLERRAEALDDSEAPRIDPAQPRVAASPASPAAASASVAANASGEKAAPH